MKELKEILKRVLRHADNPELVNFTILQMYAAMVKLQEENDKLRGETK